MQLPLIFFCLKPDASKAVVQVDIRLVLELIIKLFVGVYLDISLPEQFFLINYFKEGFMQFDRKSNQKQK